MGDRKYKSPAISRIPGVLQQAFGQTCSQGPDNSSGLCTRGFSADEGGVCGQGGNAQQGTCSRGFYAAGGTCSNGPFAIGGTCVTGLSAK